MATDSLGPASPLGMRRSQPDFATLPLELTNRGLCRHSRDELRIPRMVPATLVTVPLSLDRLLVGGASGFARYHQGRASLLLSANEDSVDEIEQENKQLPAQLQLNDER